jgi:hypothetical protein
MTWTKINSTHLPVQIAVVVYRLIGLGYQQLLQIRKPPSDEVLDSECVCKWMLQRMVRLMSILQDKLHSFSIRLPPWENASNIPVT